MGKAPSKAEVAKLTLDPYFEVRPLAERGSVDFGEALTRSNLACLSQKLILLP